MNTLTLALDWTPNINHIGFFVALEKGFYREHGLNVEIVDPSADNYALTPAKKVELGQAQLALCPTESIISYRSKSKPFDLIAIATLFQEDLSAIAVKADSPILSPKDLDGKAYASYQARYEDGIVKQMIRNDGGEGNLEIGYPDKLGIWNTLLKGDYQATWIFVNWEGVEAEQMKLDLRYFRMKDFDIPYSYSPVIAGSETLVNAEKATYINFLEASKKGWFYSQEKVREAIDILQAHLPEKDRKIDLQMAHSRTLAYIGKEEDWGKMDPKTVETFLHWIYEHGLEAQQLELSQIINQGF